MATATHKVTFDVSKGKKGMYTVETLHETGFGCISHVDPKEQDTEEVIEAIKKNNIARIQAHVEQVQLQHAIDNIDIDELLDGKKPLDLEEFAEKEGVPDGVDFT